MVKKNKKTAKGWIVGLVIGLLLVAMVAVPLLAKQGSDYQEETVQTNMIENYYLFYGNVVSSQQQTINTDQAGKISRILVAEGQKVSKGDILLEWEDQSQTQSPITGYISDLNVFEGQNVIPGIVVCEVIDLDHLQAELKVDEYTVGLFKEETKIPLRVEAADVKVEASWNQISTRGTLVDGIAYYQIYFPLEKKDTMRLGMSVEAEVLKEQVKDVATITMKAVQFDEAEEAFVYVQGTGKNKVEKQMISLGVTDGKIVEVTQGLSIGQIVLYPANPDSEKGPGAGLLPPMPGR